MTSTKYFFFFFTFVTTHDNKSVSYVCFSESSIKLFYLKKLVLLACLGDNCWVRQRYYPRVKAGYGFGLIILILFHSVIMASLLI